MCVRVRALEPWRADGGTMESLGGEEVSERGDGGAVSYTHFRAHETREDLVCRLLLEKKKIIKF